MVGMPPGTGFAAGLARRWRAWQVSPRSFQLVAAMAVWALVLTIVSGAAVRLTGSGLGCPDWPNCTRSDVVAPLQFHAWVEFGNRLINAAVTIAALGAMVAALRRAPRRRDLTWLSMGLVVGLVAEVALGAIVVDFRLAPGLVTSHFLLGMIFLADAVILHQRARLPDQAGPASESPATVPPKVWLVGSTPLLLARIQLAATAVAIALGTVVTSTGPHGGAPGTPRFHFSLHAVAQLHGTSVELLLGVTLLTVWSLARNQAPAGVMRARGDRAHRHGGPGGRRLHPVLERRSRRAGRPSCRRGRHPARRGPPVLPWPGGVSSGYRGAGAADR